MAKNKGKDKRGAAGLSITGECDLDGGYASPIKSFKDITFENVRSLVTRSHYFQILVILVIIGSFLRFYNLGYNSLWLDEASTYTISQNSFLGIWQTMMTGEVNPPLFYWIEHVMLLFGNSEIVLRLVPALAGVLSIPVFYFVGKEFLDRNAGLISAALCMVAATLVYYSQEARAYSLALLFTALGTLFFLKALRSGSLSYWALFGIFMALAFWTHFYVIMFIAALIVYIVVLCLPQLRTEIPKIRGFAVGLLIFLGMSSPIIFGFVRTALTRSALSQTTLGFQGTDFIIGLFYQFADQNEIATVLFCALFILGTVQIYRLNKSKGLFLITVTGFVLIASYILSFKIPMECRYVIFISLVFFLGIAGSYLVFFSLVRNPLPVYALILIVCVIGAPWLFSYYSGYIKADWRGIGNTLAQTTQPGDSIVCVPGYISQPLDYYYSNKSDGTTEFGADNSRMLDQIYQQKGNRSVYYVVTQDIESANPKGDAMAWINNNTQYFGSDNGIHGPGIFLFVSR